MTSKVTIEDCEIVGRFDNKDIIVISLHGDKPSIIVSEKLPLEFEAALQYIDVMNEAFDMAKAYYRRKQGVCIHCGANPESQTLEFCLLQISKCRNCLVDIEMNGDWTGCGYSALAKLIEMYGEEKVDEAKNKIEMYCNERDKTIP